MTSEEGVEEKREERIVRRVLGEEDKTFKLWTDEKYFVDDRDLPLKDPREVSDVFTSFRKTVEPLRTAPRKTLPAPSKDAFPPLPPHIPAQFAPFSIPDGLDDVISALHKPLGDSLEISNPPSFPPDVQSAHPFHGGAKAGHERVKHLIESGSMTAYKDTRNGLLGTDFSTKLSAWLALGCITARQVHWALVDFEDGLTPVGRDAEGYGKGENKGTTAVRFELLWRDYMRLCTRKFGPRLFRVEGFRNDQGAKWKYISSPFSASTERKNRGGKHDRETEAAVQRFLEGRTGTGLIDASQRELFLTGYTSNRARQNVASYLAKHLGIDWRLGAEWYETNLIDYDVSSNWGNWQYVAGVGNDPRGEARVFNPVKQAVDYDANGDYVRAWVPELRGVGRANQAHRPRTETADEAGEGAAGGSRAAAGARKKTAQGDGNGIEDLMGVFQAWRLSDEEKKRLGLEGVEWVERPLVKIDFHVNRRGGGAPRGRGRGGGGGGGGRGGGRGRGRGEKGKRAGGAGGWRTGNMEKAGMTG
ncbi:hypothetical protein LTR28_003716 [Elasticomyces elasticus]|nr:hypothetical protein LTR28_003716 [Elasticomyces elasticus]